MLRPDDGEGGSDRIGLSFIRISISSRGATSILFN